MKLSKLKEIIREEIQKETIGHTYDDIADMIYNKLKKDRNWESKAEKMIKSYTKNPKEIKNIMNMLRGEDYFDTSELEW